MPLHETWNENHVNVMLEILRNEKKKNEETRKRFLLLTSAGTRSSEKNDEDDDSDSVAKGDRCLLSTAPEAITMGV